MALDAKIFFVHSSDMLHVKTLVQFVHFVAICLIKLLGVARMIDELAIIELVKNCLLCQVVCLNFFAHTIVTDLPNVSPEAPKG